MAEAIAIRAPTGVQVTESVTSMGAAGITGLAEGLGVRLAARVPGTAGTMLTWGSLIGVPIGGVIGALFTRGMLGDAMKGIAAAGFGILGYSMPELISPTVGRRAGSPAQVGGGAPVKLLPAGVGGAPARAAAKAAAGARSVLEF